ncbi:MAG TPA: DoxX family protein, partial [Thermoleophilaceae bacterium]|nr:DoxX family protein [Thermoleophilaceae bacterium]
MQIAYIIVVAVFTAVLSMSARMKLVRDPVAVEVIGGVVGVPLSLFPLLALLEVAGALGLLVGIGLKPLGVAAAGCLVVYFVVAIGSHLRKRDLIPGHVVPAVVMLVISAAALALRLAA